MYIELNKELSKEIENNISIGFKSPYACKDTEVLRRNLKSHDCATSWRPAFVRDIEKIMHCPYYNRYADKTQVLSFYKNDDITRRALHVQYVARIAKNIGRALGLNEDLIEAIALGHDIGHTPLGHAGERILNDIYNKNTGRYFNHNVHSVRVLDSIFSRNLSVQVLDGILCHNGELELREYRPVQPIDFDEFDKKVERCYLDKQEISKLIPTTLEGCVVRVCDIIAYLGKDRQDACLAKIISPEHSFSNNLLSGNNAEIINNFTVNIIENSYGKAYIKMSDDYFEILKVAKRENYEAIYRNEKTESQYGDKICGMFEKMYEKLLDDLKQKNTKSYIYTHHIDYIGKSRAYYGQYNYEENNTSDDIVVDYIASMTDDYFVDLYEKMFPEDKNKVEYTSYFE